MVPVERIAVAQTPSRRVYSDEVNASLIEGLHNAKGLSVSRTQTVVNNFHAAEPKFAPMSKGCAPGWVDVGIATVPIRYLRELQDAGWAGTGFLKTSQVSTRCQRPSDEPAREARREAQGREAQEREAQGQRAEADDPGQQQHGKQGKYGRDLEVHSLQP